MTPLMTSRDPWAGGFFLILPIVVGFSWGLATGVAMKGALIGLAMGIVLAFAVWLLDRSRRPR